MEDTHEDGAVEIQSRKRRVRRSTRRNSQHPADTSEATHVTIANRRTQDYDLVIPSDAGTAGQILRVKLINFMCHGHFEIYLKKHVNFVFGRNGSGKSSILQAIQLCFGSAARETGRGSNLSSFVKTVLPINQASFNQCLLQGCSSGKILVSIWNTGEEAYHRHLYGRVITVEKTISTASSYYLINEGGHRSHCKKGELETMMEHLGISCENPAVVLTQDAAGSFLRHKHLSSGLYSLYMKVTEFETIAEQHAEANESLKASKAMLDEEKDNIKGMQTQIDHLAERAEHIRERETATIRLHHFRNAVGYFTLQEQDQQVSAQQHKLQEHNRIISQNTEELTRRQETIQQLRQEKEDFNAQHQLQEVNNTLNLLKREQTELLMRKREAERDCKEPQRRLVGLERDIEDLNDDIKERQKRLQLLQEDDGAEVAAARAAFDIKVQNLTSLVAYKESNLENAKQRQNDSRSIVEEKRNQLHQIVDHCRQLNAELGRLNAGLAEITQSQSDPLSKFGGEAMKRVCQAIDRNKSRFEKPPIGPVGKYLSLKDDLWSTAIEFAIGRWFSCFLVNSHRDEKLLRDLFNQVSRNLNPTIIVFSFDRRAYDLGPYANPSVLTIMKVLQISHFEYSHIVSNMLIDYGAIERTGLANSEDEALSNVTSGSSLVKTFWLPTGRKVYKTRYGHASLHDGRQLQPRLVKDTSRLVQRTETEVQQTKSKLEDFVKQRRSFESEVRTLDQDYQTTSDDVVQADSAVQIAKSELNQMIDQGPELPPSARYTTDQIQQDLTDLDHRLTLKQREFSEIEAEVEYKKEQIQNIDDQMMEKKEILKQTAGDVNHKKRELESINSRLREAQDLHHEQELALESLRNKQTMLEEALEELKEAQNELDSTAREQCSPDVFQESLAYLKHWCKEIGFPESELSATGARKQIVVLKRLVRNLQNDSGESYEELMDQVEEKKVLLEKQEELVKEQDEAYLQIEAGYQKREDLYRHQQKAMAKKISDHFRKYMRKRGHAGQIKTDHGNKIVQILVRPAGQEHGSTDMATLSGGERSYTTVSLLMAFASVVSSPFHCMDEFDVFTDVMTKHYSMMILLEAAATEKLNSQFIFFSPLEAAAVDDARKNLNEQHQERHGEALIPHGFIEIHNMPDPKR